jgi:hypothetical protein
MTVIGCILLFVLMVWAAGYWLSDNSFVGFYMGWQAINGALQALVWLVAAIRGNDS